MIKTNKDIDYGDSLSKLSNRSKVIELMEQIVDNNNKLMNLLNSMTPGDYNYYLPKVQALIGAESKQPEDDVPDCIFPHRNDK